MRGFLAASRVASWAVMVTGGSVLLGWFLDLAVLKSIHPSLASMKPNTALGCFCLGASLGYQQMAPSSQGTARRAWTGRALARAVLLLGSLTLLEYMFHVDLGIDVLLVADRAASSMGFPPGRMSPATAVLLVLAGGALLSLDVRPMRPGIYLAEGLALACGFLSFLALVGYLYGVRSLYLLWPFSSLALHTALALLLLSALLAKLREVLDRRSA